MSYADQVRELARQRYIEPARKRGEREVRILVRDVHKELGLENRYPIVCNALRSEKFLSENHLSIDDDTGPPSGFGASVEITFRLNGTANTAEEATPAFLKLRGIGKEVFQALGGGEAFIRRERESFYSSSESRPVAK